MIILYLLLIPIVFVLVKSIIYFIVRRYGKISYDGLSAAGFIYSSEKDVFYSSRNAWQKKFGYCHLYDVSAPIFRMIIDTEPVKFFYNNKNWLIAFWKGQYGITTGAEIGVYSTNDKKVNSNTIYFPGDDSEQLDMSFALYKNGKLIEQVSAKHWWLAMFKMGMFSNPKDLSMYIKITFPNYEMLSSFLNSFYDLGYNSSDFKVLDNTFFFNYKKPKTFKVWTRSIILDAINQYYNRKNVELYNSLLSDVVDNDKIDNSIHDGDDKLFMLNEIVPDVLKNDIYDNSHTNPIITIQNSKNNYIFLNSRVRPKKYKDDNE